MRAAREVGSGCAEQPELLQRGGAVVETDLCGGRAALEGPSSA